MKTNLNKIQVSDSLGNLVDAVNILIQTIQTSDQNLGNLDELTTIDSYSIVRAINSVQNDIKTLVGERQYFADNNVEKRLRELNDGLGSLSQYDFLTGTNLLAVIDNLLVMLEEASGGATDLNERLSDIDQLISQRSQERLLSAEQFGIVSSSTEDQTEKVIELFNHASASGASVVYFPPGIFRFRPITVQASNMVIRGSGRKTIFRQANVSALPLFQFKGTTQRAAVVSPINWGETTFAGTSLLAGLKQGDFVRVTGRVSLATLTNPALSGELTVGAEETAPVIDKYYSEFNQVSGVNVTEGKIVLRSGVNSNTLNTTAPDLTYYDFRTGVVMRDLTFEQTAASHKFLELEAVKDFIIENVNIVGTRSTTQVTLKNCLNVKISNTTIEYNEASTGSKGILISSSENCIVEGGAIRNSGMGVCIESTSSNSTANALVGLVSRSNTVKNVEITNSLVAGVHEVATHDTTVTNCNIRGTHGQGVFSTGRRIRVEGSTIQTSRMEAIEDPGEDADYIKVEEVGVNIFGAGSQDGVIMGNTIEGSVYGVNETGPTFRPKDHSGLKIVGNSIVNCFRGVVLQRPSESTGAAGINNNFFNTTIMGNTFRAMSSSGQIPIYVNFYVNGFQITGNSFFGNDIAARCLWLAGHFDYASVIGNSAIGFTESQHIYIGIRTGSQPANLIIDGNIGNFNVAGMLGRISRDYGRKNMSLIPSNDNWFDLGLSGARWRDVYLRNSPSVTSDRNEKENIKPENLGMNFVSKLQPVSYKLIENQSGRRHHGLIAQDVERTLKQLGVDTNDHGALVIDDEGKYSLRYEELTSSLILAVQELNKRLSDIEGKLH